MLRPGADADFGDFIALIDACWREYPGCVLDLDGEVPELRALASHFAKSGGALFAAETGGIVIGMVATEPVGDGVWELHKMYVAATQRGTGLAGRLLAAAEAHAGAAGARRMILWTDTRFTRAHRFYENHSYVRDGAARALHDKSRSIEYPYAKPLIPAQA